MIGRLIYHTVKLLGSPVVQVTLRELPLKSLQSAWISFILQLTIDTLTYEIAQIFKEIVPESPPRTIS